MDRVDSLRLTTLPTITWTTLRVAHMTTETKMSFLDGKKEIGREESDVLN